MTTEVFDDGGYFDLANSRWTPPAGPVVLSGAISLSGNFAVGSVHAVGILKNGVSFAQNTVYESVTNQGLGGVITAMDIANGTDYYELYAYSTTSSSTATVAGLAQVTYFQGQCMGGPEGPEGPPGPDPINAADIMIFSGGLTNNNQKFFKTKVVRAFSFPTNLAGSYVLADTAATASYVITFKKNGVSFGTATFAASGSTATLSVTATTFAAGDVFSIEGPATADVTLADVQIALLGSR
jgi:hypothetical protein